MPIFIFTAAEKNGKIIKGERDAENEKALAVVLKEEGMFLLDANEKGFGFGNIFKKQINVNEYISLVLPVGIVDKMYFTRNLAVMISAGLSLTRALESLAKESHNAKFRKIILAVNASVVKGNSFAQSLREYGPVFGTLYVNMIEVGEVSGKLVIVLKLLARQMKKDYDLRKRVRGAMIYPAIILTTLIGIGALMMIYVVPMLSGVLKDLKVELPLSTRIMIATSDFLVNYTVWVAALFIVVVVSVWRFLKTQTGKSIFDHAVLYMPIFGKLIKKFNIARFCRTLSYLLTSGVSFVHALEVTASVLGNTLYGQSVRSASQEIQKGKQLNEILGNYPKLFDQIVVQLVGVGEETGKISEMMLRLALFYEEDVATTTKNLSTIIEPLLMVVIGAAVGFFAVSILQPIYGSLGGI